MQSIHLKKNNLRQFSSNCIWSYSIYGFDEEKYYFPMLHNIELAIKNKVLILISTTPEFVDFVYQYFKKYLKYIIIQYEEQPFSKKYPKILRYYNIKNVDYEFIFFKDSDSIVTEKELSIMNYWMNELTTDAIIIRDHPLHVSPIMAGMFGIRKNNIQTIVKSIEAIFIEKNLVEYDSYSYDQSWLNYHIYPLILSSSSVFTSFFYYTSENIIRIKRELENYYYIGAQYYKKNKFEEKLNLLKFYGNSLLCFPYKLWRLGRIENILILTLMAFLYTKLNKMFINFNKK